MLAEDIASAWPAMRWRRIGGGAEGTVAVGRAQDDRRLRLKRFERRSDLCRYAINAVLLDRERRRLGYESYVRVARVLTVDEAALSVISEFVRRGRVRGARARDQRTSAMNAMIAIGGYVGAYDSSAVSKALLAESRADLLALGPRPAFHGLDLNDTNWVYDGASWVLIDF